MGYIENVILWGIQMGERVASTPIEGGYVGIG